jgi:hypothetical protein
VKFKNERFFSSFQWHQFFFLFIIFAVVSMKSHFLFFVQVQAKILVHIFYNSIWKINELAKFFVFLRKELKVSTWNSFFFYSNFGEKNLDTNVNGMALEKNRFLPNCSFSLTFQDLLSKYCKFLKQRHSFIAFILSQNTSLLWSEQKFRSSFHHSFSIWQFFFFFLNLSQSPTNSYLNHIWFFINQFSVFSTDLLY